MSILWSFIQSKLGIILVAALALGAFGVYHKFTMWNEERKIENITKERDKAILDLYQERQKVADLEATIRFQRNQLSIKQKSQKETSDVKKAVSADDREFLYNNWNRLYNSPNSTTLPKDSGGDGRESNSKTKVKTTE